MISVFDRVENSIRKGENAGNQKLSSSGTLNFKVILCVTVNPFPNKPWFLRVCSTGLLKTLWE